jgi:NADH-quinone oxidoreductase subunit N
MDALTIPPVDLGLIAPLLVVVTWATGLLLVDTFFIPVGRKKLTGYLAIAGLVVAGLVGLPLWGVSGSTFGGMVRLDPFALTLTWVFLLIGILSITTAG